MIHFNIILLTDKFIIFYLDFQFSLQKITLI